MVRLASGKPYTSTSASTSGNPYTSTSASTSGIVTFLYLLLPVELVLSRHRDVLIRAGGSMWFG